MRRRWRIEEVLAAIGVDDREIVAVLRSEGLFTSDELEPFEAEELRVATALMRDLGVNAAGVDVALHLRRRLLVLQERLQRALASLDEPEG